MDRLRALQYFVAAADLGSLSKAARQLDVTVPAVAKMMSALERDLGVVLFERGPQGLILTTAGEAYLGTCRPALQQIHAAGEDLRDAGVTPRGTVVVGVQHFVAQSIVAPALAAFHARYPDIQVDFREATQVTHVDAPGVDIFVSLAWPQVPDMIHRSFPISRFIVVAAPAYWKKHGRPRHPDDLAAHDCLLLRTQLGTLMDLWEFEKGGERVAVAVNGWAMADNAHRDSIVRLARAGEGVLRVLSWSSKEDLQTRRLVPVLEDWVCSEAPPVSLSYRPSARRVARVRVFIDFLADLLRKLEKENAGSQQVSSEPPQWARGTRQRASGIRGKKAADRNRLAKVAR